jgi:hypothetical protein
MQATVTADIDDLFGQSAHVSTKGVKVDTSMLWA